MKLLMDKAVSFCLVLIMILVLFSGIPVTVNRVTMNEKECSENPMVNDADETTEDLILFQETQIIDQPSGMRSSSSSTPTELESDVTTYSNTGSSHYFTYEQPTESWQVVGLRSEPGATVNYDLSLYWDSSYTFKLAESEQLGDKVDFIVVERLNYNIFGNDFYPKVDYVSGSGAYGIEYYSEGKELGITNNGPYQMTEHDIVRVWDVFLDRGVTYDFELDNLYPSSMDLGFAIFSPSTTNPARSRADAARIADWHSWGQDESFSYTCTEPGWYGLVVWKKGSDSGYDYNNGEFMIHITPSNYWTAILYFATDNNLETAGEQTLEIIKNIGSGNGIDIVALIDRNPDEDGPDSETTAHYVTPSKTLTDIPLTDIDPSWVGNELDMSDPNVLYRFMEYCIDNYSAINYLLILHDHGYAWQGCCWDYTISRTPV